MRRVFLRQLFLAVFVAIDPTLLFSQGQSLKELDETTKSKLTISGFCLCDTRLGDLKAKYDDLMEVEVEEMNLSKACNSQDTRFAKGIGFSSNRMPGIVFQEANVNGYVGKLRLTKEFQGKLPNGTTIEHNEGAGSV